MLALAAMVQAASCVDGLARTGGADPADVAPLLESLFSRDPLPDARNLARGLDLARALLEGREQPSFRRIMGCIGGMMSLSRKIRRDAALRGQLAEGMNRIERQREYFGEAAHPSVVAAIAQLYGESLSRTTPRIVVRGRREHLARSEIQAMIRALLLSGIRAAHHWHQAGGRQWDFLLRRRRMTAKLAQLANQAGVAVGG